MRPRRRTQHYTMLFTIGVFAQVNGDITTDNTLTITISINAASL